MHQNSMTRRLWWKELRQIAPLVGVLVATAVFLHSLFLLQSEDFSKVGRLGVFLGLPGMFAIGAGALLISQEKELRTLAWIISLPVSWGKLVTVKLLVSLVCLAVVWFISLGLIVAFTAGDFVNLDSSVFAITNGGGAMFTWPLHSLFLLLAGVALAWRCSSSFLSLALIVPVAFLPTVVAGLLAQLSSPWSVPYSLDSTVFEPYYLIPSQLLCCLLALVWGWQNARAALGPAQSACARAPTDSQVRLLTGTPHPPFSALLWQATHQNKVALTACVAILASAACLLGLGVWGHMVPAIIVALSLVYLAVCWLGVVVFQGDRLNRRMRFLADRGIAPVQTWLSRQAVPVCVTWVSLFVLAAGLIVGLYLLDELPPALLSVSSLLVVSVLTAGFVIFGISQWVSQLFSSPIIASIAGPAVAMGGLSFAAFAVNSLGAPVWLLALCSLLPWAATYYTTQRWMDERYDLGYWTVHGLCLAGYLILLTIPFAMVLISTPTMTRDVKAALLQEVSRSPRSLAVVELVDSTKRLDDSLVPISSQSSSDGAGFIPPRSIQEQVEEVEESLRHQLDSTTGRPVKILPRLLDFLRTELKLTGLHLEADLAGTHQTLAARYDRLIEMSTRIVARARLSPELVDQDMADKLEIVLLKELLDLRRRELLQDSTLEAAAAILADRSSRNAARRRAVALSWNRWAQARTKTYAFGGYNIAFESSHRLADSIVGSRRTSTIAQTLWQYANSPQEDTAALREQLADLWKSPPAEYGLNLQGKYFRADNLELYLADTSESFRVRPGALWHADWERQAQALLISAPGDP